MLHPSTNNHRRGSSTTTHSQPTTTAQIIDNSSQQLQPTQDSTTTPLLRSHRASNTWSAASSFKQQPSIVPQLQNTLELAASITASSNVAESFLTPNSTTSIPHSASDTPPTPRRRLQDFSIVDEPLRSRRALESHQTCSKTAGTRPQQDPIIISSPTATQLPVDVDKVDDHFQHLSAATAAKPCI